MQEVLVKYILSVKKCQTLYMVWTSGETNGSLLPKDLISKLKSSKYEKLFSDLSVIFCNYGFLNYDVGNGVLFLWNDKETW